MKELHILWYVLIVVIVVTLVLAGWMFFTTQAAYTALATTTGTIDVHAFYNNVEVGATVTVIDQGFHDMGDVNWDGKIDVKDVSFVSSCYGKLVSNYPNCGPADITGRTQGVPDGKVDAMDVGRVAAYYGKTAPSYITPFTTTIKAGQLKTIATYSSQTKTNWTTILAGTINTINFYFTPPTCSDGTSYSQCSSNKPKYCNNGNLIDKCSVCGCPSGQTCQSNESCIPSNNHLFYVVYHDILVDSNGHPNNNAQRIANAHPTFVHTYAEISGNNIPQEVRDLMHNKGVKILCYVKSAPPDSTSPPFSDSQIRSEIARAMNLGCDGIMLDNVRKFFDDWYSTYKGWRDYIKTWGSDKIAWFNTGHSDMDESIMQVADIVEVEHHFDEQFISPRTYRPWTGAYPSSRFAANVVSWVDINYYPLGYRVTLDTAIRDTNHCWNDGKIAYMYSGDIVNSVGWLPTWFENYVSSISY